MMNSADLTLPLDAFVRSVGVNHSTPHAFFLGAGASVSSGMPSAEMCIWEWKRNIFLTNNLGLESQFTELSLPSVRARIQHWLDKQGLYPELGSSDEYGVFIESCFPISENRRAYFSEKVRAARPHIGYQLLCLLSEASLVRSVWTTNFDSLVAKAAASFSLAPVEVGIDCKERASRPVRTGELLIVSMHGDYRYDQLKNTAEELRDQETSLQAALVKEFRETPIIVCGYSARDDSVMRAFASAVETKSAAPLYWCVQSGAEPSERVLNLIKLARSRGRQAYLVPSYGFDDLLVRLAAYCLDEDRRSQASNIVASKHGGPDLSLSQFRVEMLPATAVIKSNAFEIECPSEVLSFELMKWPQAHVWRWVKDQCDGKAVVAVPFRQKIFALGTVDDVRDAFTGNINGNIQRAPVSNGDLRHEEGAMVSLMREALVRAMASSGDVESNHKDEIWFKEPREKRSENGETYLVHDSVLIFLRQMEGRQHLVLKPSLKIGRVDGAVVLREISDRLKLSILGYQHNREFNEAVNLWRMTLLSIANRDTRITFEFPPNRGSTFRFQIRRSPIFAEIGGSQRRNQLTVDAKYRPLFKQKGLEVEEPKLLFANKAGSSTYRDAHPVRGIVNNRPFDYSLTRQGLASSVRLGVICAKQETEILHRYLQRARERIPPGKHEADYLPLYPGFDNAFGLPLELPEPGNPGWTVCTEPPSDLGEKAKTVEIAKIINRGIEALQASFSPHVVLVFYPDRWSTLRRYETDAEQFDVHDFVKANSIQRGIGTQFLEQSTLSDPLQCRVWWWLSLAFYVKAMRTPWVLEGLDRDTAFVGLGVSQKRTAKPGQHVVLGCSHIYSSRGEGLQYRLSKVENPIFYGRNPFLSRDDARRVGEIIRELFFQSRERLPARVVIHKRTRFTKDESLGLKEGLSGISEVEMLEVVTDRSLRYVASGVDRAGNLFGDSYPVPRGTAIKVDDYTALVWVHGATTVVSSHGRYFQGKRRIPAPLMIRRYAGTSELKTVAEEVLGLSKMNWNTFDLYTKLPATVHSSNEIARIGSLLESFGAKSYDFRLFI